MVKNYVDYHKPRACPIPGVLQLLNDCQLTSGNSIFFRSNQIFCKFTRENPGRHKMRPNLLGEAEFDDEEPSDDEVLSSIAFRFCLNILGLSR
jgi:hypothetical protein